MKKALLILPLLLVACAINDVNTTTTAPPPITANPPPSLNFVGTCETTKDLENWLQVTTQLVANFQTKMNEAAGKSRNEAFQTTIELIGLRDAAYKAATPDCGHDVQQQLTDAMSAAVKALQSYVNGDAKDVTQIVADANTRFDQVMTSQNDLINRVNTQIQSQIQQQASATP